MELSPHLNALAPATYKLALDYLDLIRRGRKVSVEQFLAGHPGAEPAARALLETTSSASPSEARRALLQQLGRTTPQAGAQTPGTGDLAATVVAGQQSGETTHIHAVFDRRYRILQHLGQGGFGSVYLVEDLQQEALELALKVILPTHTRTLEREQRFRNEIRILRSLHHPRMPQIFNDGKTDAGEIYYTMTYVEGKTLSSLLEEEPVLPAARCIPLLVQILELLDYAHSKGVVHRDLKPSNILVLKAGTPAENVCVLDFGIAKVLAMDTPLLAKVIGQTVGPIGTPLYMSPEQIQGQGVGPSSDLYSLALIAYAMLFGRLPAAGVPLERSLRPKWLRDWIARCFSPDPRSRPSARQSLTYFASQLATRRRQLLLGAGGALSGALLLGAASYWLPWRGEQKALAKDDDLENHVVPGPAPGPVVDTNLGPKPPPIDPGPVHVEPAHPVEAPPHFNYAVFAIAQFWMTEGPRGWLELDRRLRAEEETRRREAERLQKENNEHSEDTDPAPGPVDASHDVKPDSSKDDGKSHEPDPKPPEPTPSLQPQPQPSPAPVRGPVEQIESEQRIYLRERPGSWQLPEGFAWDLDRVNSTGTLALAMRVWREREDPASARRMILVAPGIFRDSPAGGDQSVSPPSFEPFLIDRQEISTSDGVPLNGSDFRAAMRQARDLGLDLPTCEEWRIAATWNGRTYQRFSWGEDFDPSLVDEFRTARPAPLSQLRRDESPSGVWGMGSGLAEWCRDAASGGTGWLCGASFYMDPPVGQSFSEYCASSGKQLVEGNYKLNEAQSSGASELKRKSQSRARDFTRVGFRCVLRLELAP